MDEIELGQAGIAERVEKYYKLRKLSLETAESFKRALHDILNDCPEGGPVQSYFEYLKPYWPDLTLDDYRENYRSRFEYQAEFVWKEFIRMMRKLLS